MNMELDRVQMMMFSRAPAGFATKCTPTISISVPYVPFGGWIVRRHSDVFAFQIYTTVENGLARAQLFAVSFDCTSYLERAVA